MTLGEYFSGLRGKRIAVLGYGVSNRPLVRLMVEQGLDVTVRDRRECEPADAKAVCGDAYLENLAEDVIFRTPGLMPHVPEIAAAVERGAVLTSEMEAFFEVCPCKIIAITGSDGKTTTSTIIAELLRAAGHTIHLGGNIGTPLLERVDAMEPTDYVVLELSSFQLITMRRSADIVVVTNVTPNHLDIHSDLAEYIESKRNAFAHQGSDGIVVLNAADEVSRGFADTAKGAVRWFNADGEHGASLAEGELCFNGEAVMNVADIKIPGAHNVQNYLAAIAALAGIVPFECMRAVAQSFGGVEHRLELVRELRGVRFYNDSIASSPTRTIAGLRSFDRRVILMAGGKDKGIAYDAIGPEIVKHVKHLVLTGPTAEPIRRAVEACAEQHNVGNIGAADIETARTANAELLSGVPTIVFEAEFEDAVYAAAGAATDGDIVIMSPASTSFDRFANFEERGKYFKEIVNGLE